MKRIIFIIILFFIFTGSVKVFACSLFNATTIETVIVGRNNDFYNDGDPFRVKYIIEFNPAFQYQNGYQNGTFISIMIVEGKHCILEGMNDKGLFMGLSAVPKLPIKIDKSLIHTDSHSIIGIILEKCTNVDESVEEMKKYAINFHLENIYIHPYHFMIVDASGKSVIIEYVNNEMRVIAKKGRFQHMTNYYISKVECSVPLFWKLNSDSRYSVIGKSLENDSNITEEKAISILNSVASPRSHYFDRFIRLYFKISYSIKQRGPSKPMSTQTSIVYDLRKRNVTLVRERKFDNKITFNLDQELAKGWHKIEINQ